MGINDDFLSEQELKDRITETRINGQLNECKKYLEKFKKDYPHSIYFEYFGRKKLDEINNRFKPVEDQIEDYQSHEKQIQKKPVKEDNKENIVTVKYQPVYSENDYVKEPPADTLKDNPLLIKCESCQNNFSKRAIKCPKCGWLPTATCEICSEKIPFNSEICPECGDPKPFEKSESKIVLENKKEYVSISKITTQVDIDKAAIGKKFDWPALIILFVALPLAFTFGGIWVGLFVLVVGVVALGWCYVSI